MNPLLKVQKTLTRLINESEEFYEVSEETIAEINAFCRKFNSQINFLADKLEYTLEDCCETDEACDAAIEDFYRSLPQLTVLPAKTLPVCHLLYRCYGLKTDHPTDRLELAVEHHGIYRIDNFSKVWEETNSNGELYLFKDCETSFAPYHAPYHYDPIGIKTIKLALNAIEEDDEAVQQVVFDSETNLQKDNNEEQDDNDDDDENTTETQALTPQKLSKKDIDNMSDEQILVQGLKKDQTNFQAGVQQEVINRATKLLQKNQTGTLTDKDRQNIINAIITMQNEEGKV